MALLQVRHYPDTVLTKISRPVTEFDAGLRTLATDMVETMYAAPGVGLAGPQVAVLKRVVVIDCGDKDDPKLVVAVNPEILEYDGESYEEEGCLSVPEYYANVKRSAWVRVRFQNLQGEAVELETEGLLAVCFQHEIDHLNGKLFVDRLSSLKKGIFRKKYKKIMEQRQEQL
ncbi:MAG: peptide deformylase [Thermodesulfobacteriota bacterium]|nr:peptide deformylase [Thermodesulfobacteriota bacterium]